MSRCDERGKNHGRLLKIIASLEVVLSFLANVVETSICAGTLRARTFPTTEALGKILAANFRGDYITLGLSNLIGSWERDFRDSEVAGQELLCVQTIRLYRALSRAHHPKREDSRLSFFRRALWM
jgi:hypothetical protein